MAGRETHIGTSGWRYPSGAGAWDGIFYPPRRAEVPVVDCPEPPAGRLELVLHAAPRSLLHPGAAMPAARA